MNQFVTWIDSTDGDAAVQFEQQHVVDCEIGFIPVELQHELVLLVENTSE